MSKLQTWLPAFLHFYELQSSKTVRKVSTPESVAPNESFDVSALHGNKTINRFFNDTGMYNSTITDILVYTIVLSLLIY